MRIPIMAIRIMIRDKKEARFAFYWGFAKGIVQAEYMNWIWTWDEAEEICAKKSARRRKK